MRQARTVADELRTSREMKGLRVDDLANELRIKREYLEALEKGRYNDLPSPVYIKNYLQRYAKRLGVSWAAIEERYKQEISVYHQPELPLRDDGILPDEAKPKRKNSSGTAHERPLVIGRWVSIGVIGIVVLMIVVYFLWGLARLSSPPDLVIETPVSDVIVSERSIDIVGKTAPESVVQINGQAVSLETDGRFSEEVFLHEGLNEIIITTETRRSGQRAEIRNILYDPTYTGE
jgi:cytoskeletal protein RodZ